MGYQLTRKVNENKFVIHIFEIAGISVAGGSGLLNLWVAQRYDISILTNASRPGINHFEFIAVAHIFVAVCFLAVMVFRFVRFGIIRALLRVGFMVFAGVQIVRIFILQSGSPKLQEEALFLVLMGLDIVLVLVFLVLCVLYLSPELNPDPK